MPSPARLGPAADALRDLLRPAGREAGAAPRPPPPGTLSRWRDDPRCARALPTAAHRLREVGALEGLAPPDRAIAEAALAWGRARAEAMAAALARVARAAAAARAAPALVKGAALHGGQYADPAARPAADADLVLRGGEAEALDAALAAEGCARGDSAAARLSAYRRVPDPSLLHLDYETPEGVPLEVKADAVGIGCPLRRGNAFLDDARPSPAYPGLLVLAPVPRALQQAFALARRPGLDLLGHAELAAALAVPDAAAGADRAAALLAGEGLEGILLAVLRRTEDLYPGSVPRAWSQGPLRRGGVVPPALRRRAARVPPGERGGPLSFWLAQGLSSVRRAAFLGWLARRAVPPEPLRSHLAHPSTPSSPLLRALRRGLSPGG